jgi:hypothetical protein
MLAAELDWSTLRLLTPSAIDDQLAETHCDLAFAMRLRGSATEVGGVWAARLTRTFTAATLDQVFA